MVIISACLAGKPCRYDGRAKADAEILQRIESGEAYLAACPECLGGLPIPRTPSEISAGTGADVLEGRAKVLAQDGEDRTAAFRRGAEAFLRLALEHGCKEAILKEKSPSCGCGMIYDGTFTGSLRPGNGVAAELLARNGIKIQGK